jgi:ribosomal-protein-alanine N-acetyltransferase
MPQFRKLNIQDLDECIKIWDELKGHYEHPIGGDWTLNKIRSEIQDHHAAGAFNDAGVMEAFCLYRTAPGVREILLLVTALRLHRTGAMKALIRSIFEELNADEVLWLEVHASNLPAIALYESLGFQLTGERKNYYSDGGKALLFEYKPLQ